MPRTDTAVNAARAEPPGRAPDRSFRPGVTMPDWSVVTSGSARRALEAVFAVAGRDEKWSGLGEDEDRVWRAILEGFASAAAAPSVPEIAAATGLAPQLVAATLDRLRARDLVVRADDTGAVTAAYPFCTWSTGHRVRWDGAAVQALCAIDALGMGAMLGRDVLIDAECRHCGATIRVATRRQGTEVAASSPEGTVVWCGIAYAGNCGATSGCTLKVFFCSDQHLQLWRDERVAKPGFRLSVEEAHQVGRAIFAPMLRPGLQSATP
jgi:mercuric reductase